MTTTRTVRKVAEIAHCPWNPRGEITPESVADLTASIKAKGLLQEIGIMKRPDGGGYWAIYGNRRLVAAKEAGIEEIPVRLFEALTETDAREITRIENEVRLGIDPLRDAELLHSYVAAGRSYEDIALMFGTSRATICRREKLVALDESIRAVVREHPGRIATNALERIAAYPAETQRACAKEVAKRCGVGEAPVTWNDVQYRFHDHVRELDAAPFVKEEIASKEAVECHACARRTGAARDLFGEVEEGGRLGSCLDAGCFKRHLEAWQRAELERLIPKRCEERVKTDFEWRMSGAAFADKWDAKEHPCAWWCIDYAGRPVVKFGPSQRAMEAAEMEKERAEVAEREEARRKAKAWNDLHDKALRYFEANDGKDADEDGVETADGATVTWRDAVERRFGLKGSHTPKAALASFLDAYVRLNYGIADKVADGFNAGRAERDPAGTFIGLVADAVYDSADGWGWEAAFLRFAAVFDVTDAFTEAEIGMIRERA